MVTMRRKIIPRRADADTITHGMKTSVRGGPSCLDELKLDFVFRSVDYLVLNKGPDTRLDGEFHATIEKAVGSSWIV